MKSAETKIASSTSHQSHQDAKSPFFKKDGEGTFFSESSTDVLSPKTAEPFFSPTTIQPKLKIGQPNDKYEKEADATAERVVAQLSNPSTETPNPVNNTSPNNTSTIQAKTTDESLQLKEEPENEEISMKEMEIQRKSIFESAENPPEDSNIQRQASDSNNVTPSSDFESQLNSSKGGGAPLPKDTQSSMESGFGADFGNVRVHDDSSASEMSESIGAQAFTHGSDIYFNEGKYDTESKDGQELLAHELTHTVQQGGADVTPSIQKNEDDEVATPETTPQRPTDAIDITHRFDPNAAWQAYLESERTTRNRNIDVPVKIGSDYHGNITIRLRSRRAAANRPGRYRLADNRVRHYLDIEGMGFLNPLREAGVDPILVLNQFGDEGITTGYLSVRKGNRTVGNVLGLIREINENLEAMNFLGLEPIRVPDGGIENVFEEGRLLFQINELTTTVDGFLEMGGGIGIVGNNLSFNLNTNIDIEGLASGEFMIARDETGALNGRATIEADIANIHATIVAEYLAGVITLQGTGTIQSEKFNGSITLLVTDSARATQMMHAALGVDTLEDESESTEAPATPKTPANQVLVGWGEVTATITPWLEGSAKVGIDAAGHVTMVGELTVPDEIELMEQRGKKVDLFEVEIRAGYGIPLVGQVFLFANIGMFVNAGFGPLVLRDIRLEGVYSTDPAILQQFSISGSLAINAFAVLGLEAEAGVGVTLIGHDITAGVNVTAAAGIRAYALATPTFEYAESQAPEGGKVGEAHLRGHFEAAAQLFLQLTGALFYELDSPWWSPAPDGREEYPLGEVQYPIGDSMGIGADLDWLVGSPDVPELEFSPVEFDPEQFTADVMADPPPNQRGNSEESPEGEWQDGTAEGDLENQPAVEEGGEGIPRGDRQEENLRNLPDEQKYMRGLSEISDIAESRERPTKAVVEQKMNRIKNRYGLAQVQIRDESDEQVKIFVRHARQDNGNHLVEVPIMNEAERVRLLHDAMQDLDRRMEREANEEGKLSQQQAQSLSDAWHEAHPIIESIRVIDGGDSWDFQVDIGDRNERVPGKGKVESTEVIQDPDSDANANLDPEEKERRVREGLDAIAQEERQYLDSGAITKEEAEQVAISIKVRFPIFTSLEIRDGEDTWEYYYTASAGQVGKRTPKDEDLPPTDVTYSMDGGKASQVIARPLTRIQGNTRGSHGQSRVRILGWDKIPEDQKRARMWVRAHLLNADYHGPATPWNLVPGTKETNNNQKVEIENPLKAEVNAGKVMYTTTDVEYFDAKPSHFLGSDLSYFPRVIRMEYGELESWQDGNAVKRGTMKQAAFFQDEPDFANAIVPDINTSSAGVLWEASKNAGFNNTQLFYQLLVIARRKLESRFTNEQSLYNSLLEEVQTNERSNARLERNFDDYFSNLRSMYQSGLVRFVR